MVEEERGNLPNALRWVAHTYRLIADHQLPMLEPVTAHLARLRERMGADDFRRWWLDNTGAEPPDNAELSDNAEPPDDKETDTANIP